MFSFVMNSKDITILSLNCRGLGERCKRKDLFNFLKKKDANIYCLQDTHFVFEWKKKY